MSVTSEIRSRSRGENDVAYCTILGGVLYFDSYILIYRLHLKLPFEQIKANRFKINMTFHGKGFLTKRSNPEHYLLTRRSQSVEITGSFSHLLGCLRWNCQQTICFLYFFSNARHIFHRISQNNFVTIFSEHQGLIQAISVHDVWIKVSVWQASWSCCQCYTVPLVVEKAPSTVWNAFDHKSILNNSMKVL